MATETISVTGTQPTLGSSFWLVFRKDRLALALSACLVVIVALAAGAPFVVSHDPETINVRQRLAAPDGNHLLGTDEMGRDVLSRLLHAGRISLSIGLSAALMALVIGGFVGAVSGYFGGAIDTVLMRLTDAALSIPRLILLLVFASVFRPTIVSIVVVIAATSWMDIARLVRGEVLKAKEEEFVLAVRAAGAQDGRILWRHIFPQAIPTLSVATTLAIAYAMLLESALSFLGMGVQAPTATWGNMLRNAQQFLWVAPRLAVFPGMAIFLTVMALNRLGDAIRDVLDPRSQTS